jgi:FkbM family methyltransferase
VDLFFPPAVLLAPFGLIDESTNSKFENHMKTFGFGSKIINLLPEDRRLKNLARQYLERFNGENNSDPDTNGEMNILRALMPGASVVFDCGANVGNWTRSALAVNPRLVVHCFEPMADNFAKLKTLEIPGKIICNNFGVGAADEEKDLHIFPASNELNSLFHRPVLQADSEPPKVEKVKIRAIDGYVNSAAVQHIDFLKLDVEGNEIAALGGAIGTISTGKVDVVQFEYGGCNIDSRTYLRDFFDYFTPYPFDLYKILPLGIRRCVYSPELENFAHQNWLAVRRDCASAKSLPRLIRQ